MKFCIECDKRIIGRSYHRMCRKCYAYRANGGLIHPLPPVGSVDRDADGNVICHICGRSYARLGSHIKETHGISTEFYKKRFRIPKQMSLTSLKYRSKMQAEAEANGSADRMRQIRHGETVVSSPLIDLLL